jgi:V/A-type H+-transporting ATPase subunit E
MEPDISVQSLLDKIKREGIEEANTRAQEILAEARGEAERIIGEAQDEAEKLLAEAKAEIARNREAFESSMSQAGRDLVLGLKNDMSRLCQRIMEKEVASALTPEVMKEIILRMAGAWRVGEPGQGIEVLTSEKDRENLEKWLFHSLRDELKTGITLKPIDRIRAGFRIGEKGGSLHYDFTHEGVAEILMEYLNPRIAVYLEDISEKGTASQG